MRNEVIRYYDSNTSRFLRFGHGSSSKAIHRAVWAEGVENRQQAMNFINSMIVDSVRSSGAKHLLDIGCGVGGSMLYIAGKTPARLSGVTISPRQAETGRQLFNSSDCSERCSIIAGDFTDPQMRAQLPVPFDTAYAIESFLHMPSAELFFKQAARVLKHGGDLFICDDVLASNISEKLSAGAGLCPGIRVRLLRRFKRGWQVGSLYAPADLESLAESWGFRLKRQTDLTDYLELNRPRDLLIRWIVMLIGWVPWRSPFMQNLLGGDALQKLLLHGDLRYMLVHLQKI
ncbi:MAG: class I SAM-dependent methyltransferase [Spirochaetaceae bacterium]|nr:class I SAM-dependent methyltransferase [Spirochaetaceae bacterium]MCF7951359.1 class I SAM-dependent methyltransferase [Spirochaetaceae bacterium]